MSGLRGYGRLAMGRYRRYRHLARQRNSYAENKRRHLKLYQPDPGRARDQDLITSIIEHGVAVVREFLPMSVVEQIVSDLRPSIEAVAANRYGGPLRTRRDDEGGLFRLYGVEETSSPSRMFFESPFIADLANAMTVTGMHSKDRYVDYKAKIGGRDPNIHYHIDHWKLRFKAFLLLQDVAEDQGPFVYLAGSHREEPWRRRRDWDYQQRDAAGAILRPDEVKRLCRRYGFEERVFTANAGDLILANTRGIHRGLVLNRGTRLQLVNLFAMNGPPEYAC